MPPCYASIYGFIVRVNDRPLSKKKIKAAFENMREHGTLLGLKPMDGVRTADGSSLMWRGTVAPIMYAKQECGFEGEISQQKTYWEVAARFLMDHVFLHKYLMWCLENRD